MAKRQKTTARSSKKSASPTKAGKSAAKAPTKKAAPKAGKPAEKPAAKASTKKAASPPAKEPATSKAGSRRKGAAPVEKKHELSDEATADANLQAAAITETTMIETVTVVKKKVVRARAIRAVAYVQYKGPILAYLISIRPQEATLEEIRRNVEPPVDTETREEIFDQDLFYLIQSGQVSYREDGQQLYRAS